MQKIAHCLVLQNDYLEAIARQLYDYWFVQFDFPDEDGKPYKSSGGKMVWNEKLKRVIPEGWKSIFLGEMVDMYQPKTLSLKDLPTNGKYRIYGANGIVGRYEQYNHKDSEVAMACRGNSCGVVNRTMPYSWITSNAMVLKMKNPLYHNEFILQNAKYINIAGSITGSGQPQLTRENLSTIVTICPNSKTLLGYSRLIKPIVDRELSVVDELEGLLMYRESLLPLLMNGQVSVKPLNNHLSERGALIFRNVVGLAAQGIFKNCFHKVICSKIKGCFLDLAFIFELHFSDFNRPPVTGLHPAIIEGKDYLCARLWILRKLLFEFFKGGYLFSLGVSDEVILCLNREVCGCFPVISFFKLETSIEPTYLVQVEIMLFNPFVIKEVKGVSYVGMKNGCDGTNNLIPSRSA